jgi:hypothetical protein
VNDSTITIKVNNRKRGKANVTLSFPDGTTSTDSLELADAKQRACFITKAVRGKAGITKAIKKELAAALEKEAANDGERRDQREVTQADRLVQLVAGQMEFFHGPGGEPKAYASFTTNDHRETWPIQSSTFRQMLGRLFFLEYGKAANQESLGAAINTLVGKALFEGKEVPVAIRVAECDGAIYLDLCDPNWKAVEITVDGWQVISDCPVRFIRRRGMMLLPEPVPGGSIDELRSLVNLPDEDQWILYICWLIAAFRPDRPMPILAVSGEQGSCKSTLCRIARGLVDPNEALLRRLPKDERDLGVAGANNWLLGFDNVSGIPAQISDALCCIATGGGFGGRTLYTDDEQTIINVLRPVLLNGIEDIAERPDLIDRTIALTLPAIEDDGTALFESNAIMRFLCNKHAPGSPMYPADPASRGVVDQWLDWRNNVFVPPFLSGASTCTRFTPSFTTVTRIRSTYPEPPRS